MSAITLPTLDQSRLDACEKVIERGLASFVEVGEALFTNEADATLGDVVMGVAAFLRNYTDAVTQYRASRDRRLWVHFARVLREGYDAQRRSGRLPEREISIKAKSKWRIWA